MKAAAKPRLCWKTPLWSRLPAARQIWRTLFRVRSLARVTVASLLTMAVLLVGCKIAFPLFDLGIAWRMLLALPAIYLYVLVMALLQVMVPARVEVRSDRVAISQGQTATVIRPQELRAARITCFADDRVRLRLFYLWRGRLRTRTLGLAAGIDLERLCALLPVEPRIIDARRRSVVALPA